MIRIVADDKIPFLKGALEGAAEVKYIPGAKILKGDLMNADALIIRTRTKCNKNLLEGTNVRFIASATIGYDHIDEEYCKSAGISWTNAPGCNASSVKQYIVSSLLYLAQLRNLDLSRLTLGVVGVGNVGRKVADAGNVLGMKVLQNDPPRERQEVGGDFVSIEAIQNQADIITLHVPVNMGGEDNTFHLVNKEFIHGLKKEVILINTSRGPVVEEGALLKAINSQSLSDVILDVFEKEPVIDQELLSALTIATPHIAGYSLDGKAKGTTMSVQAISRFFNLDLNHWVPSSIPQPQQQELFADASQASLQTLVWDLYQQTYNVKMDDQRLRNAPGSFEKQRGDYPLRREAPAYSVRLFQGYKEIISLLENLEFSVLSDYCA